MGDAIGQILAFGVGAGLSPLPIIGVILVLGTPRARVNGLAFLTGWLAGIAVVGTIVLIVSSGAGAGKDDTPAEWVSVLQLGLAVLLLAVAVRQWRGRPHEGEEAPMPAWAQKVNDFTPGRAGVLAFALAAVNPKNLLFVVGAAAAIARTGASTGSQAMAFAVFTVIASLGVGVPVVLYLTMSERSARILGELKAWMSVHNAAIMTTICLILAAKLAENGISGLAA